MKSSCLLSLALLISLTLTPLSSMAAPNIGSYYSFMGERAFSSANDNYGKSIDCNDQYILIGSPNRGGGYGWAELVEPGLNPDPDPNAWFRTQDYSSFSAGGLGTYVAITKQVGASSPFGVFFGVPQTSSARVCTGSTLGFDGGSYRYIYISGGSETGTAMCEPGDGSLLISAPRLFDAYADQGGIYRYDPLSNTSSIPLAVGTPGAQLGQSLACLDLDNNGSKETVITGSPGYVDANLINVGRLSTFQYQPGPSYALNAAVSVNGTETNYQLGASMLGVGDVNGDAKDDLLVGLKSGTSASKVYLYSGDNLQSAPNRLCIIDSPLTDDISFGETLAKLPDLNGDKRGEFAIGAPAANGLRGRVYFYTYDSTHNPPCYLLADSLTPSFSGYVEGPVGGEGLGTSIKSCSFLGASNIGGLAIGSFKNDYSGSVNFFKGLVRPTPTPTPVPTTSPTPTPTGTIAPVRYEIPLPSPDKATEDEIAVVNPPESKMRLAGSVGSKNLVITLPKLVLGNRTMGSSSKSYRYLVRVKGAGNSWKDSRAILTKQNRIVIRDLKTGTYTVQYRVQLVKGSKVLGRTRYSKPKSIKFTGR